ncbi:4Fe-4S ferredoxin N-terminal domain-containing protein [Natronobiforma cellulositropha]|uniref:4Fe-4S ferredoxin N-terminal domain-containing protein n=1 Tax=Natronobiforma cellulositropha TaxID=1679076 RepID=UPI0021D60D37|nr:4Fe-4S ferredoxin N-terminal domain-containing protein [Natronobiforma cellulositropha]
MIDDDNEPSIEERVSAFRGDDWEDEMRAVLDEGEYDTELGIQMARDARRLVAGELEEADFHERYHDAVVEEFGVDDRPLETSDESAASGHLPVAAETDEEELERREVLQKMGAAGAFVGLGAWATAENRDESASAEAAASDEDDPNRQWGMVIDLDKCDGCLSCVIACSQENQTSAGSNWMYVFTYEDDDQDGENFLVRTCQMCTNAPCEKVCPTTARHTRTEDGLVLTDYDVCIGCRYCQVACPYGVNYFQWGEPDVPGSEIDPHHAYDDRGRWVDSRPPKGVMGKCTMCPTRQDDPDRRGTTGCEDACSMDAIYFGDMNDPESDPNQYLETVREENPTDRETFANRPSDRVSTFRLLEELGTEPNVVFVGNEPGPNAKQVEGPVSYEEMGQVDRRKDVLDEETFAGGVFS